MLDRTNVVFFCTHVLNHKISIFWNGTPIAVNGKLTTVGWYSLEPTFYTQHRVLVFRAFSALVYVCACVYVHVSIEQCKLLMGEMKNKLHGQSMADVDVAVELVCSFVR